MHSYEAIMLFKKSAKPELVSVLKRTAPNIFNNQGTLFATENLGTRSLPYAISSQGKRHREDRLRLRLENYQKSPSLRLPQSITNSTAIYSFPNLYSNLEVTFPKYVKITEHCKYSSPEPEPKTKDDSKENPDKPNREELQRVYNILQKSLEKTFTTPMDYSIYHRDVVFIDRIRNLRTEGLTKYVQQVALLKIIGHIKFAYVRFDIVNMNMDVEESRITVRWRIKGLSGIRVMLKFWKYKLWKWQEIMNHQETWYDGISYFDIGTDGKIFQHIADKVMEDKHRELDGKPAGGGRSIPLAAKLGGLATIFPTPSLTYQNGSHSSTLADSHTT